MRRAFLLLQIAGILSTCAAQGTSRSISGNAGIASAVMHLSGAETTALTANFFGNYSFYPLPPGKYVVTPSLSGYTFSPSSRTVTIAAANVVGVSFTATATTTKVKEIGLVASPASFALKAAGATQQLKVEATYSDESSKDVTSGATYASNNGSVATVSQTGLVTAVGKGNATVIASYGGLASSVSTTVSNPAATYSISGSVGTGSATVTLTGPADVKTTASSTGTYSFSKLPSGSYTITPSLAGHTFFPGSEVRTITNANLSGVNFTAIATPHSVDLAWSRGTIQNPSSGEVIVGYNVYRSSVSGGPYTKLNGSPVAGLTYTDNAVSAGQTWYYVCSSVDNVGNVSPRSNQTTATIP